MCDWIEKLNLFPGVIAQACLQLDSIAEPNLHLKYGYNPARLPLGSSNCCKLQGTLTLINAPVLPSALCLFRYRWEVMVKLKQCRFFGNALQVYLLSESTTVFFFHTTIRLAQYTTSS